MPGRCSVGVLVQSKVGPAEMCHETVRIAFTKSPHPRHLSVEREPILPRILFS